MQILFLIMLFIVGTCLGSFLCCQARRLHLKATQAKAKKYLGSRSICLSCRHQLKWYDNFPILSWILLKGKCRYCHHKIGCAEILSELCLGLGFFCLGTTIDVCSSPILAWTSFLIVLFFATIISFLAIYDGLYGELPSMMLYFSLAVATIFLIIQETMALSAKSFSFANILNLVLSILILGGTYLTLYLVSKGKWVGDGDWLLAAAMAIVLAHPWLAINTLFVANFAACAIALPFMKGKKNHQIHLGPFLVVGFVVIYSASSFFFGLIGV